MQKLKQTIVKRKSHTIDEGTMGFHDCVEKKEIPECVISE